MQVSLNFRSREEMSCGVHGTSVASPARRLAYRGFVVVAKSLFFRPRHGTSLRTAADAVTAQCSDDASWILCLVGAALQRTRDPQPRLAFRANAAFVSSASTRSSRSYAQPCDRAEYAQQSHIAFVGHLVARGWCSFLHDMHAPGARKGARV